MFIFASLSIQEITLIISYSLTVIAIIVSLYIALRPNQTHFKVSFVSISKGTIKENKYHKMYVYNTGQNAITVTRFGYIIDNKMYFDKMPEAVTIYPTPKVEKNNAGNRRTIHTNEITTTPVIITPSFVSALKLYPANYNFRWSKNENNVVKVFYQIDSKYYVKSTKTSEKEFKEIVSSIHKKSFFYDSGTHENIDWDQRQNI